MPSVMIEKGHPMLIAWEAYEKTPEYRNTRRWALHEAHVDGSLWAAFEAGYRSRKIESGANAAADNPALDTASNTTTRVIAANGGENVS